MTKNNASNNTTTIGGNAWPKELIYRTWKLRVVRMTIVVSIAIFIFILGWIASFVIGDNHSHHDQKSDAAAATHESNIKYWTCSMHPHIKLPEKGQCPICFMDLIPVRSGEDDSEAAVLTLSARARTLAKVETTPVQLRELIHEIRMVGKVLADETRITYISSYIPGRIDRLFVDYTGIFVRKGDHLTEIYSPELLVAQREFLVALDSLEEVRKDSSADAMMIDSALTVAEAARRKLELWGIPADEITTLIAKHQPSDHMRIDSPLEGWVLDRQSYQGMYVETGTRLFTVADLRSVWVLLDAYELDVPFLRIGQTISFESESYAGETFTGRIAYLDPILNENTRTVKVRVNVPNTDLKLRPGMFVRGQLIVHIGAEGKVIENSLLGKWICPMHPEIIKDQLGTCNLCGMDLVTSESLGYVSVDTPAAQVLAIPKTAVLLTGRRAVVYIEHQDEEIIRYEGREIELGPPAGDYYVVLSGLSEGEQIVTHGALMIDSVMQIHAKPSMMNAADEPSSKTQAQTQTPHHDYHPHTQPVMAAYFELVDSLADDDLQRSRQAISQLQQAIVHAQSMNLQTDVDRDFKSLINTISTTIPNSDDGSIEQIRQRLPALTQAMIQYLRRFGHNMDDPILIMHCPMAMDNQGADWLQIQSHVRNPYFGAQMLSCGVYAGNIQQNGQEE
ncbi:MAG: hypothetical protein HJJLKODD_00705 [Phycisphaerae bacterium]|nr:hypothetical protein [Phycisphaerae bacterium]